MTKIGWYSLDTKLKVVQHEPVDYDGALVIIDQYISKYKLTYEHGEDAIAENMFGFSRADNDFIEICINGLREISIKIEFPNHEAKSIFKIFQKLFVHEENVSSRYALQERVRQYFTLSHDELRKLLK